MCAISGIVNTHGRSYSEIITAMMNSQQHRGPDDCGVFECEDAAFAHCRLSVISREDGHQPMISDNGRIVVILNGEIYNFRQLRTKLSENGHKFLSNSDTEVLIHLYESFGSECISRLDGMFAFAIFDRLKRRLLLGRDRLGQKPLLYFMDGDTLVFASEFSGLQQHPAFPYELDKEAVSNFMSLQYVPQPDTAFRNVRKLPPGHIMELDLENGNISIRCYWQADFSIKNSNLNMDSATAKLRTLVEKAVEKRLYSDVPLGTFLSGGVDSCIVTGIAAKLMYPRPCDTFTAAFSAAAYDERDAARRSAEIINQVSGGNLRHHEREIQPDDFAIAEKLAAHFGEPFADASALPLYLLCNFAKEKISVALCGDGADEIFAGYERYLAMRYAEKVYWMPQTARKFIFNSIASLFPEHGERSRCGRIKRLLKLFASPERVGYFNLLDRCPGHIKRELFGPQLEEVANFDSSQCFTSLDWELIAKDRVEKLEELDLRTYLPGDILPKADISSMANALELRSPFLDTAVVEFASRLPMKYKLSAKRRKYILCAAFPEFITPELLNRPKRGFGVPIAGWLRDSWKDVAYDKLFNSRIVADGFVRKNALEKYWQLHQEGRDFSYLLWNLIVLEFFLERNKNLR
ncbi:MAG: asparagine synthase (glutamine-hydrolyzing) [Lentisphaerae bacterium]|nr:asparagine synthase (glutamine-hydrolyzing) [Lentisphaerota bacterium]